MGQRNRPTTVIAAVRHSKYGKKLRGKLLSDSHGVVAVLMDERMERHKTLTILKGSLNIP